MPSESSGNLLLSRILYADTGEKSHLLKLLEVHWAKVVPASIVKPLPDNFAAALDPVFVFFRQVDVVYHYYQILVVDRLPLRLGDRDVFLLNVS
jgi:hypothetical protein